MNEIMPKFLANSFKFEADETPAHIDEPAITPCYVGLFEVFGAIDGVRSYSLAVDIQTEELAVKLAKARATKQEDDIACYGYSDDVYILYPSGRMLRTYLGRSEDQG